MKYKKYETKSFNIYTIKTDKFKNCHMEIIFRDEVNQEKDLLNFSFLADLISDCSKNYPSRRDISIALENLYNARFYGVNQKVGKTIFTSFLLDFVNPKYITEEDYLTNVLKLQFEIIMKPYVKDEEFDITMFNIIKNRIRTNINNMKEDPTRLAINHALKKMDETSVTSYRILGTIEQLEEITPSSLYKVYKHLINDNSCDIFIIGDLDMDKVAKIITDNFKLRSVKSKNFELSVENKTRKKPFTITENGDYVQANLIMIYNLVNLSEREKNYVIRVFNFIFGNGSLNAKLMNYLREENGLCYGVSSMYLKRDNLLMVQVSLEKEKIPKAMKLIKKALNEMTKGDFTDEDMDETIKYYTSSVDLSLDNEVNILDNYLFHIYDNIDLLEDIKKEIKTVKKDEVIKVANKIKLNTIYTLVSGGE